MFTMMDGLAELPQGAILDTLLVDQTKGGDVYMLLKDKKSNVYYIALNGKIFLLTVSAVAAYSIYHKAVDIQLGNFPEMVGRR